MIREAKPLDTDAIINLGVEHGKDAGLSISDSVDRSRIKEIYRKLLINPNVRVYVYEENGTIAGYVIGIVQTKIWNDKQFGEIMLLFVHPEVRNRFVADNLMEYAVKFFKEKGCMFYMASSMHFDDEYKRSDEYCDRASKYFTKLQHMTMVGETFVKEIV